MVSKRITRRDFLKVTGVGAAASAVIAGCKPASPYLNRQLNGGMPGYTLLGKSKRLATTCGECPAGCGLIVRTVKGCVLEVEGNPDHPANRGNICARSLAALQGLNYPERLPGPQKQACRGSGRLTTIEWKAAIGVIQGALTKYAPGEIAFLLGLFPDHLNDLVQLLSRAMGGANVLRFTAEGELEGRVTMMDAAQKLFGVSRIPHFDLEQAEVVFSFGANFTEAWFSPAAHWKSPSRNNYRVQFGPRLPESFDIVAEWVPIRPGSEVSLAQALARLVSESVDGPTLPVFARIDLDQAAEVSGVAVSEMRRLARLFADAVRQVAIPGYTPLGSTNGLAAAQAILSLNVAVGNLGKKGGVYLPPNSPIYPELSSRPSTLAEIAALIERMNRGQVKALLVHGANPVYDVPRSYGFAEALENLELVISFASFLDETALQADYLFPDHTPLEAWGYQKVVSGSDRLTVSGLQPVVPPLHDTRSTADVLLEAAQAVGGRLAAAVPYTDEVDFLQKSATTLMNRRSSNPASDSDSFWALWLQKGGWWEAAPGLAPPVVCTPFDQPWDLRGTEFAGVEEDSLYFIPLPGLVVKKQADFPASWEAIGPLDQRGLGLWVEIHPETARMLGLRNDNRVKITSSAGEIEAVVRETSNIRPDTVAIPPRSVYTPPVHRDKSSGSNPLDLLGKEQNESGSLAFSARRVRLTSD